MNIVIKFSPVVRCTRVNAFESLMSTLFPIDACFCVSIPQAFINKFIRISDVHQSRGILNFELGTEVRPEISTTTL